MSVTFMMLGGITYVEEDLSEIREHGYVMEMHEMRSDYNNEAHGCEQEVPKGWKS